MKFSVGILIGWVGSIGYESIKTDWFLSMHRKGGLGKVNTITVLISLP